MTNYDSNDSPDWTPDNPQRPTFPTPDQSGPAATTEALTSSEPLPSLGALRQRRWLAPVAAVAAALMIGTVGGVAGSAAFSGNDNQSHSAWSNSGPEADFAGDQAPPGAPGLAPGPDIDD